MSKTAEKEMPKSGGHYVRDPKTGALTRVGGQTPDAALDKARKDAKAKLEADAKEQAKGE